MQQIGRTNIDESVPNAIRTLQPQSPAPLSDPDPNRSTCNRKRANEMAKYVQIHRIQRNAELILICRSMTWSFQNSWPNFLLGNPKNRNLFIIQIQRFRRTIYCNIVNWIFRAKLFSPPNYRRLCCTELCGAERCCVHVLPYRV